MSDTKCTKKLLLILESKSKRNDYNEGVISLSIKMTTVMCFSKKTPDLKNI